MNLEQARRRWNGKQNTGADFRTVPGGWSRALGGVDPYLALHARDATVSREDIDGAMAQDEIWVVPGVRGCIWLVPKADVPLALRVSDAQSRKRSLRELDKLGVPAAELEALGSAVLDTLAAGPKGPSELRKALPEGSWRSLGDAGKKKGHTTSLPTALRLLEWDGKIRRRQDNGRLDTNRYAWELAAINTLTPSPAVDDPDAALAQRFLSWCGPATLEEFVEWSALGKRAAKAAFERLNAATIDLEGQTAYQLTADEPPEDDDVYLLPAQDNMVTLHHPSKLLDPRHQTLEMPSMGNKIVQIGTSRWVFQRPVFHRGQWIGLWAWDFDAAEIILRGFDPLDGEVKAKAEAKAHDMASFITDQLGGRAKANSIDGDKSQRARAACVRAI